MPLHPVPLLLALLSLAACSGSGEPARSASSLMVPTAEGAEPRAGRPGNAVETNVATGPGAGAAQPPPFGVRPGEGETTPPASDPRPAPPRQAPELRVGEAPCETDADCVPASCCHASACTSRAQAPSCRGVMCTADCRSGTIDCGGGCLCVEGRCAARIWRLQPPPAAPAPDEREQATPPASDPRPPAPESPPAPPQQATELRVGEAPCQTDADCVPASCCHASACTSRAQAPSCQGARCTRECRSGTIDCGGGCLCVEGRCAARIWRRQAAR